MVTVAESNLIPRGIAAKPYTNVQMDEVKTARCNDELHIMDAADSHLRVCNSPVGHLK